MRLAQDGLLDLDAPIAGLFPPAADLPPPAARVTVRQLLSHTAGFARGDVDLGKGSRDPDGLAGYTLSTGIHTPFVAEPGEVYSYSDQGYGLIGYLIERVTGSYFGQAVQELVFEPLGLRAVCFDPLVAMTYPVSQQHVSDGTGGLVQFHSFLEAVRNHPSAGAFCSVHDLALLGTMHLRGGLASGSGSRVLPAATVRAMRDPHVDVGLDIDLRYGLGAYIGPRYGGHPAMGHEGYVVGSWSKLIVVPGLDLGLAWCDNRGPVPGLVTARYRAIEAIFSELCDAAPSWDQPPLREPAAAPPRQTCTGRYRRQAARPLEVGGQGGGLYITDGTTRIPLIHHHSGVYVAPEAAPLPGRLPWEPHAGSERCCAHFVATGGERATYLSLNGVVYRRDG
jgi:CubicO group peptidase (beta-lactamase class C family)